MKYFLVITMILLLINCATKKHTQEEIESAMARYNQAIESMDADQIILTYTEDGNLGDIANGRDSIKKFLSRFSGFKVLSNKTKTGNIILHKDTAFQVGEYHQIDIVPPKGDTTYANGFFEAIWIWKDKEGWLLKSMKTRNAE